MGQNKYSTLLTKAIEDSGLTLEAITHRIEKTTGKHISKEYLSRLKNGKTPPASDKLNDAIAEALNIDPVELKAAAYREKIAPEILKKLENISA